MNITQRDPFHDEQEWASYFQKVKDLRTRTDAWLRSMPSLTPEEKRHAIDSLLARKDLSEMTREALMIMRGDSL